MINLIILSIPALVPHWMPGDRDGAETGSRLLNSLPTPLGSRRCAATGSCANPSRGSFGVCVPDFANLQD